MPEKGSGEGRKGLEEERRKGAGGVEERNE